MRWTCSATRGMQTPRIRDSSGQALVEYTVLLSVFLAVWAALSYYLSADYHAELFNVHAEKLVEPLEGKIYTECVEKRSCE